MKEQHWSLQQEMPIRCGTTCRGWRQASRRLSHDAACSAPAPLTERHPVARYAASVIAETSRAILRPAAISALLKDEWNQAFRATHILRVLGIGSDEELLLKYHSHHQPSSYCQCQRDRKYGWHLHLASPHEIDDGGINGMPPIAVRPSCNEAAAGCVSSCVKAAKTKRRARPEHEKNGTCLNY